MAVRVKASRAENQPFLQVEKRLPFARVADNFSIDRPDSPVVTLFVSRITRNRFPGCHKRKTPTGVGDNDGRGGSGEPCDEPMHSPQGYSRLPAGGPSTRD